MKMAYCAENTHTPLMEGFIGFPPPPPGNFSLASYFDPLPPGNSSLAPYFASKILAFMTPSPLGISNDLPWGGYGFFLDLGFYPQTQK